MQVIDILTQARDILGGPSTVNRWGDPFLRLQASVIQRQMALDLDFPEATITYPIVGGQQEYQLDTLSKILRVYIKTAGGSIIELYPTDIPTIEGDILEIYDNSSGTVLGAPIQSPQWLTQQAEPYPMTNVYIGGTVSTRSLYKNTAASNQRPLYYLRGGYIGVLPPDAAASGDTLSIDAVPTPPDLTTNTQSSIFPRTFLMAVVWGVVKMCRMSDQNAAYQLADAEFEKEMNRLNNWRQSKLQQNKPSVFVPRTLRTDFRPGPGGGGPGWGGSW